MADPRELLAESEQRIAARDYAGAAGLLEGLAFGPASGEALDAARGLARVRRIQGRYRDELRAARRAAELASGSPQAGDAALALVDALIRCGEFDEARHALDELGEVPGAFRWRAHLARGILALREAGDWAGAREALRDALRAAPGGPHGLPGLFCKVCLARALQRTGAVRQAGAILRHACDDLRALSPRDLDARLTRAHALLYLADIRMEIGDLPGAREACEEAYRAGKAIGSAGVVRWYFLRAAHIAQLVGNLREAIRLALSPEHFEAIRTIGEPRLRFYPLANAALYAIELDELDRAEAYLARAEACVEGPVTRYEPAYLLLLRGALRTARGDFDGAERLLDAAQKAFAGMTEGGYRRGVCEVMLRRGHLCRARGDVEGALRVAMEATDIAERDGFMELRSRGLLLQSFLLVDEDRGLDDVYEDLVARAHIVNSPAILFKILSNLYFYCQKFGCYDTEAFHWQRLWNMRSVLEDSVYRDLYREYVTARYAQKITEMLTGPRPGEPEASPEAPDLPDPRELDPFL